MNKYFVVSDIHSYFDEMIAALNEAGWDPTNPNHYIICCGDVFDRGAKPKEVMKFFLTTDRVILIRGNHEDLLEDAALRGYFMNHDFINGTYDTCLRLSGDSFATDSEALDRAFRCTRNLFDRMKNYYETEHYIFVHGWIPCRNDKLPFHWINNRKWEYFPDWRKAPQDMWEDARWVNGMYAANRGIIEPNKTIVCGHWHCSYGHAIASVGRLVEFDKGDKKADFSPYYGKGIIAIDACTVLTKKVNCIVIEDNELEG